MRLSKYYLKENFFLKLIDFPALYNVKTDELYCLDERAFNLLRAIAEEEEISSLVKNDENITQLINYCLDEGILTKEPVNRINPPIRQAPFPSLRYLELQITRRCNLRCKHCFVGEGLSAELPFELIYKALKEFEEIQGLRVLITGGEPLLHREFEKINELLSELSLRKILFTNGLLLSDKFLKHLNVEEIQISLDGMEHGHNSLRGDNTFSKTLEGIKRAIDYGFDVSIATVIHKENLEEFDELEKLMKSIKIREWTIDAITPKGNLKFNEDFVVLPNVAGKIMRKYGFSKEDHPKVEGFGCGAHLLAILATGEVAYCSFFDENPIGHVTEGLEVLWERKRQISLGELECSKENCPFIAECRGGCRYRAFVISGRKTAPDLFKCYQFEKPLS